MIPKHNTGLIEGSGTKSLWVGGTIPYEVRLETGDWRPYCPTGEKQKDPAETMACVSFSCNNVLEIQNKFLGVDVNYSDRFLAKMSGTTNEGNRLDVVADTARTIGLVLESEYPSTHTTWQDFYAEVPQSVKDKAVKQVILYEFQTNDVASLKKQLKQCPLQVTIPQPYPNHAVVLVHIDGTTAYYFDSYSPFIKTIAVSKISAVLKILLLKTNIMTNSLIVKNGEEYGIYDPATSEDGLITLMRNRGMNVPLTADGKLDWTQVKVDKQLT